MEAQPTKELKQYTRKRRRNVQPLLSSIASPPPQTTVAPLPEYEFYGEIPAGVVVSLFDYAVENHIRAVDSISKLCCEPEIDEFADRAELRRFGSSITFLSEWRYFKYQPRRIRFACESGSSNEKQVNGEITLPQFSAATIPKGVSGDKNITSTQSCKDFVLNVGGLVWGIDWCPRVCEETENPIQSEFVAIATHPPGSSYHKIGAPLTGRGVIQIWCLLNNRLENEVSSQVKKEPRKFSRNRKIVNSKESKPKRPRGRPRKHPLKVSLDEHVQPVAIIYPEEPSTLCLTDVACENTSKSEEDCRGKQEESDQSASTDNVIPKDIALPRMMLCLAHNGKVAWDIKWRPRKFSSCESRHTMGFLAVLLGSGALEVWEVPFPRTIRRLYSSEKAGTDTRFVKLKPVFRCSALKCGDRQSIPLTVEWSISSSCDMILAGCHDGVVALWKFSITDSSKDTRPLLRFIADTVPIRSLAWAPFESSSESENVVITGSHRGLKFWDLRDPFYPLREYRPGQGVAIYSSDWLPNPRYIFVSCDDGSLRVQSLIKAVNNFPITGKPLAVTKQQGFHHYMQSLFPIWSVQTSRLTGMVAYCGADGTAVYFQLAKNCENDPMRSRTPHFLCGSFAEEETVFTVITPTPDTLAKCYSATGQSQDKRANDLCSLDDLDAEAESDDDLMAQINKQKPKPKTSSKKKPKPDQPPSTSVDKGQVVQSDEIKLPPKSVAIHRIRWNMNKGSEKWLCYGGAAGIVRCQWLNTP